MLCFHHDDNPSERSAFLLHLLWSVGQVICRAAGDVFFPSHLCKHLCMCSCIKSQRQQSHLELNYSAPTIFFNSRRKQLRKNCWDCQVHLLRVNPANFKKMKQASQAAQKRVWLLGLAHSARPSITSSVPFALSHVTPLPTTLFQRRL